MWKTRPKLNDIYAAWSVEFGFFANLYKYLSENNFDIPAWISDLNIAVQLDMVYHGNHSGNKYITNFIEKFIADGYITNENLKRISGLWYSIYGRNAKKQWEIFNAEYNPIENYSMHEVSTLTKTGTDTLTLGGKETEKNTGTQELQGKSDANGGIYGYNSGNAAVPSDESHGESQSTRTDNLTRELSYTGRNNQTEHNTTDENTIDRAGNIGTTTSQQMIQAEIDLWQWDFYTSYLFPSVDSLLVLSIY